MNRPTRDAQFLNFARGLVAPLDALEAEARFKGWADNGRLFVIHRTDGSFVYQFGDAEISRREAALRAKGRAS
jgi:hypothetical protein